MPLESHAHRVRFLYKTCLRLHRSLPTEMRAIGDAYVKEEFRRHREAEPAHAKVFMEEWSKYALSLGRQIQSKRASHDLPSLAVEDQLKKSIGANMKMEDLDTLSEEQLVQLYELHQEIKKPSS